jgi:hypothetical protein
VWIHPPKEGVAVVLRHVAPEPTEVIVVEIPECRIVYDARWFAVNAKCTARDVKARSARPFAK